MELRPLGDEEEPPAPRDETSSRELGERLADELYARVIDTWMDPAPGERRGDLRVILAAAHARLGQRIADAHRPASQRRPPPRRSWSCRSCRPIEHHDRYASEHLLASRGVRRRITGRPRASS
jgi:hypothetical protein